MVLLQPLVVKNIYFLIFEDFLFFYYIYLNKCIYLLLTLYGISVGALYGETIEIVSK